MLKNIMQKLGMWKPSPAAAALYGASVEEARNITYYRDLAVPDTVDGRFDLVALMVALMVLRLKRIGGVGAEALIQDLTDTMFNDMEQNLRAMGVSDEGMRYRIRDMIQAFMGRMRAYGDAHRQGDDQGDEQGDDALWLDALGRNVYRQKAAPGMAGRLAGRIKGLRQQLARTTDAGMLGGHFSFHEEEP